MRTMLEINVVEKTTLYALIILGVLSAIILIMNHRQEKRYMPYMFIDVSCLFISYMEFNLLVVVMSFINDGIKISGWSLGFVGNPPIIYIAIQAIIFGIEIVLFANDSKWRKKHLSDNSIKESMDSMPYGICCYYESGMPRLINQEMHHISQEIFGEMIANAATFWDRLCTETLTEKAERVIDYPSPTWVFHDGKVLSFVREKISYEKGFLYEILATDITEEYEKNKKLSIDNERMRSVTNRLRDYSNKVTEITIEKEVLDTKVRIHSEFGQTLVATRRYFAAHDMDEKELLDMWNKNIKLLKREGNSTSQYDYEILNVNARQLGIAFEVPEAMPQDEEIKGIILTVCNECITNAYKYAACKALELEVTEDEKQYTLRIWNEGDVPKEEIKEKGGLRNLRKIIETKGGTMQVASKPYFCLTITMEKG